MHSRIFQLSQEPFIDTDGTLNEDALMSEFEFTVDSCNFSPIFQIADYVEETDDPNEDIQLLLQSFPQEVYEFNTNENSIVFNEGFREAYFDDKIQTFLKKAEEIKENNALFYDGYQAFNLIDSIRDRHGFYIYLKDNYERPLDDFVREHLKIGQKYYFGGVVDYHC